MDDAKNGPRVPTGEPAPRRARAGRPRDETARTAILRAANAILDEKGIAGFTIEAVAARAGVAKTTIYRSWPNKGALAVAGLLAATAPKITSPESGSAIDELTANLQRVVAVYGGPTGRVLVAILTEGQRDSKTIAAFIEGYTRPLRDHARSILLDGIERGELRPDVEIEIVLDALFGPVYFRLLVPLGPLDERWAASLASYVLSGLVLRDPDTPHSRSSRKSR
jgi:AcrR family transcriptional regulator